MLITECALQNFNNIIKQPEEIHIFLPVHIILTTIVHTLRLQLLPLFYVSSLKLELHPNSPEAIKITPNK